MVADPRDDMGLSESERKDRCIRCCRLSKSYSSDEPSVARIETTMVIETKGKELIQTMVINFNVGPR